MSKTELKNCDSCEHLTYTASGTFCPVVNSIVISDRCVNESKWKLKIQAPRCEPERKEVLIQDKPTWLCGDCSRQWDVSGREGEQGKVKEDKQ